MYSITFKIPNPNNTKLQEIPKTKIQKKLKYLIFLSLEVWIFFEIWIFDFRFNWHPKLIILS